LSDDEVAVNTIIEEKIARDLTLLKAAKAQGIEYSLNKML
jgi:hypothetical protein